MKKVASLKNKVAIVGVGESEIGRVPHMSGLGLNAQAARRALDDAGLKVSDIDGLLTAYSFTEPYFMLGSVLCEYLGLKPHYNASMVVGGGSPAVMLKHAAEAIAAGQAETILVCAGENRATGQSRDATVSTLLAVGHPYFEQPYGGSIPGYYAMIAQRHMHKYGTTREQLAHVAVQTRKHALLHPNAHMKKPVALDDVLAAKPIADPLGMLDCCLISDAGFCLNLGGTCAGSQVQACLPAGHRRISHARAPDVRPQPDGIRRDRIGTHCLRNGGAWPRRYRRSAALRLLHDRAHPGTGRARFRRARGRRRLLRRGACRHRRKAACQYAWRHVVACARRRCRRTVRHCRSRAPVARRVGPAPGGWRRSRARPQRGRHLVFALHRHPGQRQRLRPRLISIPRDFP
ncbi:hypothetical protein CBM2634_A130026 [Cupriavidus taiwanensis]|uniref:Thiolase N-terminal domain-containing protein n=1 Tax=Cupriavidus taiwanensis TaxID=164546 RepID=A0A375IYC4_9BURK|nr:hypothetical protein CBM2634_A130026 [Cupriavidus taiwanensis]